MWIKIVYTDRDGVSGPKVYNLNGKSRFDPKDNNDIWTDYYNRKVEGYDIKIFVMDIPKMDRELCFDELKDLID